MRNCSQFREKGGGLIARCPHKLVYRNLLVLAQLLHSDLAGQLTISRGVNSIPKIKLYTQVKLTLLIFLSCSN